ncbi:glycosyltransferase [Halobellus rarus]|uniref:Glycosyltransferase n=1 Tax=Halobellus rarus TaxID=1126237 RepID=A0ABD6CMC4_9EURY|nr:glycosyltransferase [Halobellus rarus]
MVSIIVPVYNDPAGIQFTIESLSAQSIDRQFRVFVVDNDSTDRTPEVVRSYNDDRITLLHEDEIQGSYAARNKGIENTDSDVVAFLDADETVDKDWLEKAVAAMNDQNVDYLGCNVELTLPEDTFVGRYDGRTGFPVKQYLEEQHYAPTCALLVRRDVFEDVGPFDSRLVSGGDIEFGQRVHEAGYEQGYAEDAVVTHPARTSFEALAKKNFRVGRGFCQKQRYYPERYGTPGIPPTPSGSGTNENADEPDALATKIAFALLSVAMLACRGLGYYYEFLFEEERDLSDPRR